MKSKLIFRYLPVFFVLLMGISGKMDAQTFVCSGDTVTLSLTGVSGNIIWQGSTNGTDFSLTVGSGNSVGVVPAGQIWYRAALTNGACDTLYSDTMEVVVNPAPIADAGLDFTICEGGSDTLGGSPAASGGTPGYTYSWTPASWLSSATDANPEASPSATTTYLLTVTDTNGCSDSDDITVTVNPRPAVTVNPDTVINCGDSAMLYSSVSSGTPGFTYNWSNGGNLSDSTISNPTASNSGLYILTVTDALGCSSEDTTRVSYNITPGSQTFAFTGTIANFTIPCADTVRIEVFGAQGGLGSSSTTNPGLGAHIIGDFTNLANTQVKILVGEAGDNTVVGNGGGGGSFVTLTNNTPLVIAGGGGGGSQGNDSPDKHGQAGQNGGNGAGNGGVGGTAGNGGSIGPSTTFQSGAGGGLTTNGADGWTTNTGGKSFLNGGAATTSGARGGFGGGGSGSSYVVGGGGGGYSGGGSGGNATAGVGGGGGSYNAGVVQTNTAGVRTGNGQVIITWW